MKKTIVSFQGEFGAFSEKAALSYFGSQCAPKPRQNFRDVFNDVAAKRSAFGVIPIENSLFGTIAQNYDLLKEFPLSIIGEVKIRIHHCLMALPGTSLKDIKHIYSHPQAIGQCDAFLRTLKRADVHQFYDTAGAAKMISEENEHDAAAIASEQAARHYDMKILRKNIETDHRNYTRFLIISKKKIRPSGKAKTSLLFTTKHVPGSLVRCLNSFAERNINVEKIESRPIIGKPWEYIFSLDIVCDERNKHFFSAIKEFRNHVTYIRILGSYKKGRVIK